MIDSPTDQPKDPAKKAGIWRTLKQHILHPEKSPEDVALSFALGFSIAWNPLLGTHTSIVLLFCLIFRRVHRPLIFAAAFINNPWTMVPIATLSAYLGNILLGRGLNLDVSGIHWATLGLRSFITREGFWIMYGMLRPILGPYLLGGGVLCLLALPIGYFGMLQLARRLRRLHLPHLHLPHHPKDHSPS
jgi:uncharacterized protein